MNRLNEIEARANAATEGPWRAIEDDEYPGSAREIVGPDGRPVIEQLGCGHCDVGLCAYWEDIEMVTASRTDVPDMAAALRAVLELHKEDGHGWGPGESFCTECQQGYGLLVPYPCPTVAAIRRHLGDDQ